jgi:hypothetical protein
MIPQIVKATQSLIDLWFLGLEVLVVPSPTQHNLFVSYPVLFSNEPTGFDNLPESIHD